MWHLSKTMALWIQFCILKIKYHILCKTEGSTPLKGMGGKDEWTNEQRMGKKEKILTTSNVSISLYVFHTNKGWNHHFNPFPNKPWFLRVCSTRFMKTLWEKEKLLVTSNFSFSRSVFHPFRKLSAIFIEFEIVICKLLQFEGVWNVSFGKGLKTSVIYTTFSSLSNSKLCQLEKT